MIPCEPGRACTTTGLGASDADCDAGAYCLSGATLTTPTLATEGGTCEAGYFCPIASVQQTPCYLGTFNPAPGGTADTDCGDCTAGMTCNSRGLDAAVAANFSCAAGFYCPIDVEVPCEAGNYCPSGSAAMTPCAS
jgi:hypothetical protein